MNFLRQKVSGKKKRFVEGEFDLDLTYVTQRIIAMSLPGEGIQGIYRNPIDKVATFLNKQHEESYFVFNLSGITYDEKKFQGEIFKEYVWKDHHSPSLNVLFEIVLQMHNILKATAEPKNVIVVHCLAGKGRTGTVICCYLLYTGKFNSVKQVMDYYGKKRFSKEGLGVNQPCQIKYIEYFYELLQMNYRIYPTVCLIKKVSFLGKAPSFNMNGTCKPIIEVIDVRTDIKRCKTEKEAYQYQGYQHKIMINGHVPMAGDVLIKVKNQGMMKNSTMFRFAFNTAFFNESNIMKFSLDELDPSQVATDDRFDKNFTVEIEVLQCTNKCDRKTDFKSKCEQCKIQLSNYVNPWTRINEIINRYQKPDDKLAVLLLFGDEQFDDVDQILNKNNQQNQGRNSQFNFKQNKQQQQF